MTEPTATPIRVVLADDHALVREGLRHVLHDEPGFDVVGEAANGDDAITLARRHRPDVLLLDISMPGQTGLAVTEVVRRELPTTRVLLLSMYDHLEYVREGIRLGAHGYLLKDSAGAELRIAVRAVHAGGTYLSPAIAQALTGTGDGEGAEAAPAAVSDPLAILTARERDVLQGVARGLTNKAIAAELGIGRRTVEAHRENLMRKLDIRTVAGLTRLALECGLIGEGA
jgi:DNA-binding NarL/FixJ family response regulator